VVTTDLVQQLVSEEFDRVRDEVGTARFKQGRFEEARALFVQVATSPELADFLTLPAYEILVKS
jgi:malate synthase